MSSSASRSASWSTRLVDRAHDRAGFNCGEPDLDKYLREAARQNSANDMGKTYVLSPSDERNRVAGYYTLAVGSVLLANLPPALAKGIPSYPQIPVVLLARLGIATVFQGQGLGESLLVDAFGRARDIANLAGARAVLVDALHDHAAAFYSKYGFVPLVDTPLTLVLSMSAVRAALAGR